ncbi:MAG: hypothetical protein AB8H47_30230, partial [Bacteroidia bacterium]
QFPILDLIFLAAQNAWVHKKGFACWQTPSKDQKAMMDNYGVPLKQPIKAQLVINKVNVSVENTSFI